MRKFSRSPQVVLGPPKLLPSQNLLVLELSETISMCHVFPTDMGLIKAQIDRLIDCEWTTHEILKKIHFITRTSLQAQYFWSQICRYLGIHRPIYYSRVYGVYFVNRPMRAKTGLLYADLDRPEDVAYLRFFDRAVLYGIGDEAFETIRVLTPSGKAARWASHEGVVVRRFAPRKRGIFQET